MLAPNQRFPNRLGFIAVSEMTNKPRPGLFVNESGKRCLIGLLPNVQIDNVRTVLDTTLEGWRIPHLFPPKLYHRRRHRE